MIRRETDLAGHPAPPFAEEAASAPSVTDAGGPTPSAGQMDHASHLHRRGEQRETTPLQTVGQTVFQILIGVLILPRALKLLRETVDVLLESVPRGLDLDAVRTHLLEVPHVRGVHDLHVTQVSSSLPVLTAHVVVEDECFRDGHAPSMLDDLQACVADHFKVQVEHSTFQLEPVAHGTHEGGIHP